MMNKPNSPLLIILELRYDAARRGLSIANKFQCVITKKKHKSRIFGNMNRIRNKLNQYWRKK